MALAAGSRSSAAAFPRDSMCSKPPGQGAAAGASSPDGPALPTSAAAPLKCRTVTGSAKPSSSLSSMPPETSRESASSLMPRTTGWTGCITSSALGEPSALSMRTRSASCHSFSAFWQRRSELIRAEAPTAWPMRAGSRSSAAASTASTAASTTRSKNSAKNGSWMNSQSGLSMSLPGPAWVWVAARMSCSSISGPKRGSRRRTNACRMTADTPMVSERTKTSLAAPTSTSMTTARNSGWECSLVVPGYRSANGVRLGPSAPVNPNPEMPMPTGAGSRRTPTPALYSP